jgi:hypothetical protein
MHEIPANALLSMYNMIRALHSRIEPSHLPYF